MASGGSRCAAGRDRAERRQLHHAAAALRLVTPRGFVVEGLEAELLASLLQVLG